MNNTEVIEEIKKHVTRNLEYYKYVLIQSVLIREPNHHWKHCATKVLFLKEPPQVRDPRIYDVLALIEKSITIEEFDIFLQKIYGSEKFILDEDYQTDFSISRAEYEGFPGISNSYYEWPSHIFYLEEESRNQPPHYAPVKYGYEPYFNGSDAVKDWLSIRNFHDGNDERVGRITFCMPNYKARLLPMEIIEGKTLRVRIESNIPYDTMECQLVCKGTNNERLSKLVQSKDILDFDLPFEPSDIHIALVGPGDEKIDYYYHNANWKNRPRNLLTQIWLPLDLEKELRGGEGVRTEYKPFIDPERAKQDDKFKEVIKTCVAFANKNGGHIFIGVTDQGEVEGIDLNHKNLYPFISKLKGQNKTDREVIDNLISEYKTMIGKGVATPIPLEIKDYIYRGTLLLVIEVASGSNKPYALSTGEIRIRKGSSNMIPDPNEDLPSLVKQ